MPIKRSAKKALRQTIKRTARNKAVKVKIKKLETRLKREIAAKKKKEAAVLMSEFAQALDKAAKNHIFAKNSAARYKSRLQQAINKIG